jgi:tetratricopeptide (TPR) repeat protein
MRRSSALFLLLIAIVPVKADTFLVLPFFNLSKNANLDWIGESLAEEIRQSLASEGLVALDREDRQAAYQRLSVRPYSLLTRATVIKIGETLDAQQVIFGQFDFKAGDASLKSRGSLQITARLLDLKHVRQGPEFGEVGALEDLATLERHLAWQTLQFVIPETAPSEAAFGKRHPAVRVDAMENYIRGLLAASPEEKHRFFTQAARLDPGFSPPCFELGRLHWRKKEYKPAAEWLQKVSPEDAHSREAGFLLGLSRYYLGDYAGAQSAFTSLAAAVPLNEVLNDLGAAQSRRNLPEALDNFRKALEGDQSDPAYQFNAAYALWKQGRFDQAAERFRAVLARNPQDPDAKLLLARSESRNGPRPGDTRTEGLERLKTNYEESAWLQLKAALQPEKP